MRGEKNQIPAEIFLTANNKKTPMMWQCPGHSYWGGVTHIHGKAGSCPLAQWGHERCNHNAMYFQGKEIIL